MSAPTTLQRMCELPFALMPAESVIPKEATAKLILQEACKGLQEILFPIPGQSVEATDKLTVQRVLGSLCSEGARAGKEAGARGNLNLLQQAAVGMAMRRPPISVLFGPPGTGKSTTVVQLLQCCMGQSIDPPSGERKKRVLLLAPTNRAVDLVAHRLILEARRAASAGRKWTEGLLPHRAKQSGSSQSTAQTGGGSYSPAGSGRIVRIFASSFGPDRCAEDVGDGYVKVVSRSSWQGPGFVSPMDRADLVITTVDKAASWLPMATGAVSIMKSKSPALRGILE